MRRMSPRERQIFRSGSQLNGLFKKEKLRSGDPVNDWTVMKVIDEGRVGMQAFKDQLTGREKADLLAYLKTL
jgi:mono/diheme cytochrome c family protein